MLLMMLFVSSCDLSTNHRSDQRSSIFGLVFTFGIHSIHFLQHNSQLAPVITSACLGSNESILIVNNYYEGNYSVMFQELDI